MCLFDHWNTFLIPEDRWARIAKSTKKVLQEDIIMHQALANK
jgi:hypothetical protein